MSGVEVSLDYRHRLVEVGCWLDEVNISHGRDERRMRERNGRGTEGVESTTEEWEVDTNLGVGWCRVL